MERCGCRPPEIPLFQSHLVCQGLQFQSHKDFLPMQTVSTIKCLQNADKISWPFLNLNLGKAIKIFSLNFGSQRAVDCLMLWKLTRVGDVGMDMALATRARMECLSCHRCHLFRTAERT